MQSQGQNTPQEMEQSQGNQHEQFVRKMERMLSRARANTELFKSRHKEIERSQRQTARMLDQLIHKLYGGQGDLIHVTQN